MRHAALQLLALIVVTAVGFAAAGGDPDKDPQMMKLLQEARHNIDSKNPGAAIAKCDAVSAPTKRIMAAASRRFFARARQLKVWVSF